MEESVVGEGGCWRGRGREEWLSGMRAARSSASTAATGTSCRGRGICCCGILALLCMESKCLYTSNMRMRGSESKGDLRMCRRKEELVE